MVRNHAIRGRTLDDELRHIDLGPIHESTHHIAAAIELSRDPQLALPQKALRQLALEVKPRQAKLEPGGETSVDVQLADARGKAVADGEVAVVIVDEAVLSLTGYSLPDPLPQFYTQRDAGARDYHLRQSVLLAQPEEVPGGGGRAFRDGATGRMLLRKAAPMVAAEKEMKSEAPKLQEQQPEIKVRTDFNALALFAPSVKTDARGNAAVPVKLPDNLTRYRVMAVAVAGSRQFGKGEATITARLPIMVRPSPPRFLNFGFSFGSAMDGSGQVRVHRVVESLPEEDLGTFEEWLAKEIGRLQHGLEKMTLKALKEARAELAESGGLFDLAASP